MSCENSFQILTRQGLHVEMSAGSADSRDQLTVLVERPPVGAGEVRLAEGVHVVQTSRDRRDAADRRHLLDLEAVVLPVDDQGKTAALDEGEAAVLGGLDLRDFVGEELGAADLEVDVHRAGAVLGPGVDLVHDLLETIRHGCLL